MSRSRVEGKVAWITGASSGIGEALAYALAAQGATVVLSARREAELFRVKAGCNQPDRHLSLPLDMLDERAFGPAVAAVIERFGRVDILIHCAGMSQRATALGTQLEVDRRIMAVNYFGTVALTKHALPSMIERRSGHIVVISSLLGKFGAPTRSAYCASKHALHGFFDALRAEIHRHAIAVTIACPGFVRTNASINALEGDGTPHGKLDKSIAHGIPSSLCAEKILSAIERRRREVYIGKQRYAVLFNRFAPGLFNRLLRRVKLR